MKLVICEKPSVGAAVAAALGVTGRKDGYIAMSLTLAKSRNRKHL